MTISTLEVSKLEQAPMMLKGTVKTIAVKDSSCVE
jgi:hypothetical protein